MEPDFSLELQNILNHFSENSLQNNITGTYMQRLFRSEEHSTFLVVITFITLFANNHLLIATIIQ